MRHTLMSDEEIQKVCKTWQHALRLDDWSIELVLNCTPDMLDDNANSTVYYCESLKIAKIHILADEYIHECQTVPFNIRKTIVHELLHIKCSLLDDINELQSRILHQIIDDIAKGIFNI